MPPECGTKRQQAEVTNASTEGDDGTSRKRKKSEPSLKEKAADEGRTLYDFDSVYVYLENTKPKHEFEDFATLKQQYVPLLVQPGDDYTRQQDAEQDTLASKERGQIAKLPKDGGIFFDDIPLHHRTSHVLHPLEKQRLTLCGLAIKKWKWSRDEDEMLVENWREYAARHNVPLRDAAKFFGATREEPLESTERKQSVEATLFHPWMCKRLLQRTCKQIKDRGRVLFHPNYRLRGGQEMWTADDNELLLRLVKEHNGNFKEVALQMGRIFFDCVDHYYWLRKHGADDGAMQHAKKRRFAGGFQWYDEDAERLQHLLDRFGSQWDVVALWMDRSKESCKKHAFTSNLKFERRPGRQMAGVERYTIEPWTVGQLQTLLDFLREVLQCNPVKFLRSEESVGIEHRIDWYAASEQTSKSATECRMKWREFKEHILEQVGNGSRKKEILPGLLQLTDALKQRAKVAPRKWTATEFQQLVNMVREMGCCWVKIARELNRGLRACMEQYYNYKTHAANQAGEWTLDELQQFYDYLGGELGWHPVVAAQRRGGASNIRWEDAANVTGKSARDCRKM
ncbi:hypothetical protein AAVH_33902, partial [Aphelenchoides avenae]